MMTNILITEDHAVVRDGLKCLLESDRKLNVVGQAENGLKAVDMLDQGIKIDVVRTDFDMPEMDGIGLIKTIKETHPAIKIILLSMYNNENFVYEAFRAGASAYLMKSASAEELKFAISQVRFGRQYVCPSLAINHVFRNVERTRPRPLPAGTSFELSSRELEVLGSLLRDTPIRKCVINCS